MAATTEFYIHPYFCFRKDADSDYGITCGFDTEPVTAVTYCAEVLHCPYAPAIPAQPHVPADPTTGTAEVLARPAVPEVLAIAHVPERLAVPASDAVVLAAEQNFLLFGGDAKDSFAHSPAPKVPTYMMIDNQYYEWYLN